MHQTQNELQELLKPIERPIQRKLYFLGWLNRKLKALNIKQRPVLVGGSAVELYTAGNYATVDIDLVFDSKYLEDILIPVGFRRDGRYWMHESLDILLECPGSSYPAYVELKLENGDIVYVSAIEEIIIDRLCACVHWDSRSDCEWAQIMLAAKELDTELLMKRASEEDVSDKLTELGRKAGLFLE